ncbi:hypothetical protein EG329_004078 [Mollisiaceae sp. DMI_Dod_QoI]|nr:hypothetical protein EG329_004078 [Helotiales sp. DMI_Dod_QoI]
MGCFNSSIAERDPQLHQYTYQPIDPKDEIRILILLPPTSPNETELRCKITTAKISDNPIYEAISYCWGAEVFPETIYLPNGTLAITANLAAGLRRFRWKDRPRHIWVDAVCINQNDSKEKCHQVSLMSKIYSNAECVLVWLGEGNPDVHTGIECVRTLASWALQYGLQHKDLYTGFHEVSKKLENKHNEIAAALLTLSSKVDYDSLAAFFDQDWFMRLWVVQEYVVASKVDIYNGLATLSHEELSQAAIMLDLLKKLQNLPCEGAKRVKSGWAGALTFQRDDYCKNRGPPLPLLEIIFLHKVRICKLDQDRIYGLLALTPKEARPDLEVDYSLSVEDVYTRLAVSYLGKGRLEILYYIGDTVKYNSQVNFESPKESIEKLPRPKLPSWVPNWRSVSLFDVNVDTVTLMKYKAATALPLNICVDPSNPNVIGLEGVCLDSIEVSIPANYKILPYGKFLKLDIASSLERIVEFYDIFKSKWIGRSYYPTGEEQKLAFAKCMIRNIKLQNIRVSPGSSLGETFIQLWDECYENIARYIVASRSGSESTPADLEEAISAHPYTSAMLSKIDKRRFIMTKSGYIGISSYAEEGDVVSVFNGACTPFVLRKAERGNSVQGGGNVGGQSEGERWKIVGHCYLHGFMDNQVTCPEWQEKKQILWIV